MAFETTQSLRNGAIDLGSFHGGGEKCEEQGYINDSA
jgi:hypothetical protein